MSAQSSRRSLLTVYADATAIESHRVRLMLAEKKIDNSLVTLEAGQRPPAELTELNPRNSVPTIVDRDLVLYDTRVIMDYLDERYPHPPMMPVDPVSRAQTRLALYRIESDWYSLLPDLSAAATASDDRAAGTARHRLAESLTASADVFRAMPFFLSAEYSVLDATVAPLLWRLPLYGIVLPDSAAPVIAYARRMFKRPGFKASLTQQEQEMSA